MQNHVLIVYTVDCSFCTCTKIQNCQR